MPDGHGLRCFRVRIECSSGRTLYPILSAATPEEARQKAAVLAGELCRVTLPWSLGGKDLRENALPPVISEAKRIHRWWTA